MLRGNSSREQGIGREPLRSVLLGGSACLIAVGCSSDGMSGDGTGGANATDGIASGGNTSSGAGGNQDGEPPDAQIVDCAGTVPAVTVATELPNFEPADPNVSEGDIIEFENTGNTEHTVTSGAGSPSGLFDSGAFSPGESVCVQFNAQDNYDYYCTLHPTQMAGTISVF